MDEDTRASTHAITPEDQLHSDSQMENSVLRWKEETTKISMDEAPHVLDPEDPLMKRFQNALKAHLMRIERKLSEDIVELVSKPSSINYQRQ